MIARKQPRSAADMFTHSERSSRDRGAIRGALLTDLTPAPDHLGVGLDDTVLLLGEATVGAVPRNALAASIAAGPLEIVTVLEAPTVPL